MATIFFESLMNSSFSSFFVPFILVFAIVFGILSKINLFQKEDDKGKGKRINLGISLVIGLIFASVSLATNCLSALFPKFAIVLTVLFVLYMIISFSNGVNNKQMIPKIILTILALAGFIIILFLSSEACGIKIASLSWVIGSWWKWVVGIIIVFGMGFWIFKGDKDVKEESRKTPKKAPEKAPEKTPEKAPKKDQDKEQM